MKKLLLLSAIALCSGAAMAQTIYESTEGTRFGSWGVNLAYEASYFANVSAGDQIVITANKSELTEEEIDALKSDSNPNGWDNSWGGQVLVKTYRDGWGDIDSKGGIKESTECEFTITETEITISGDKTSFLNELKTYGLVIQGLECVVTKIAIKSASEVPTSADLKKAGFTFKETSGTEGTGFTTTKDDGSECMYEYTNWWSRVKVGNYKYVVLEATPAVDGELKVVVQNTDEKQLDDKAVNAKAGEKVLVVVALSNVTAEMNQIYVQFTGQGDVAVSGFYLSTVDPTPSEPEALKPVLENAELVGTEYYSLTGVKSATPTKGINIVRRSFSNGTVVTEKALIK